MFITWSDWLQVHSNKQIYFIVIIPSTVLLFSNWMSLLYYLSYPLLWVVVNPTNLCCVFVLSFQMWAHKPTITFRIEKRYKCIWLKELWCINTFMNVTTAHNKQTNKQTNNKLHGLSPRANYTNRATAACRRSDCQLLRIRGATWSGRILVF
jgi:hypothetical protein